MPDLAHPLGDASAEAAEIISAKTDRRARTRVVLAYQPWVRALIRGLGPAYTRRATAEDLMSAAQVGLLEAIDLCEPGRDFANYAWWRVRKSLQREATTASGQTERRAFRRHGDGLKQPDLVHHSTVGPMLELLVDGDTPSHIRGDWVERLRAYLTVDADPEGDIDRKRAIARMSDAIGAMPARVRRACELKIEGKSSADIARVLGISRRAAQDDLRRAREAIAAAMPKENY